MYNINIIKVKELTLKVLNNLNFGRLINMKYNGINVSEQEIVAKVLEDQNAWRDFSINCKITIEKIKKYKNNIIWEFYYKKIKSTYYSQEEIEKILSIILDND